MTKSTTLTVTAKGQVTQVTLKREVLEHLGVRPGDQVTVDLCSPHGALIHPAKRASINDFFGCLPDKGLSVSIEDMNQAIADGWAGKHNEDHA